MTLGMLDYRVTVFRDPDGDWVAVLEAVEPIAYWEPLKRLSGVGTRPNRAVKQLMLAMRWALEAMRDSP